MFMRMVYDEKLAQATYVIGCQRTGEAIVIDPQRDVDRYERLAAANGLRLVAAAETHIHADFLSGSRELAEKGARVYLSDEGDADWKYGWVGSGRDGRAYDARLLHDGDRFTIGRIEFQAIHTPGHTPEHLCFMVTDRGGGADRPMGVVTGDFLFVGDLGRPDLLESAAGMAGKADSSARRLFTSVKAMKQWPDFLQVWPGHGAGSACGKSLGSVPMSTVGYERLFNPAVQAAADEAEFVAYILAGQPEPPLYFADMKRLNRDGPTVLGGVPSPARIGAGEAAALDGGRVAIIDTRPWDEFRAGHLPGALHLPLNNSFPTDAGSLVAHAEPICLVVEAGRVEEAVRDLIRVGLDRVEKWMDQGDVAQAGARGVRLATTPQADVPLARAMIEGKKPLVLDVRRGDEFAGGHIQGAVNIPHTRLRARLQELPAGRAVLVNCRSGARSARACSLLQRHGHEATNLAGGMLAWEKTPAPR
jgi:hydroxyacylglutathione hydrolase